MNFAYPAILIVFVIIGSILTINAYAVDNNCPISVIHILQVSNALRCIEDRIDILENASPSGETTDCINMASQYQIIVNSTAGDCFVRSLANGTGITLSVNSTHIRINSTSSGGSESTVCTNLGSIGEGIVATSSGGNCDFKKLLAGTGISLSSNGTRITITNTLPEATVCTNVGTGNQLCSGGNVNVDTLIAGDGITITDTTDDYTFASQCNNTGSGEPICESANNINSLIGSNGITIIDTTGDLTLTHKYEFLCQNTAIANVESLSCSSLPDRNHYHVTFIGAVTGAALTPALQFNGDTATNYAHRFSLNGAADTTSTNRGNCVIGSNWASGDNAFVELYVNNLASVIRKSFIGQSNEDMETADTTAPSKTEISCKWDNTSNVIDRIDIICSGGCGASARYAAGSVLTVWGYN